MAWVGDIPRLRHLDVSCVALFPSHQVLPVRSSGRALETEGACFHLRSPNNSGGIYEERVFSPFPPLEPSLVALFGAKTNLLGPKPTPFSAREQITARLANQSHQCAFVMEIFGWLTQEHTKTQGRALNIVTC